MMSPLALAFVGLTAASEPSTLTLAAIGDVIPHTRVKRRAEAEADGSDPETGWAILLDGLRPHLDGVDLAFANLETPIAPRTGPGARRLVFQGPPALPSALVKVGVDAVSTANNHAWDQGVPGVAETLEHLDTAGLWAAGTGRSCAEAWAPKVREVRGVKIGWLAFTRVLNRNARPDAVDPDGPCVAYWHQAQTPKVARVVEKLRSEVDLVVVSLHHGEEYDTTPNTRQRAGATTLIEAGADVILGHHPHALQPVEIRAVDGRQVVVAYSLGNALSNQGWSWRAGQPVEEGDVRDTIVLHLRLTVHPGRPGAQEAEVRYDPLWSNNDAASIADPHTPLTIVSAPNARKARIADVLGDQVKPASR